jgi:alkylhydroperoxidase/carboxymuconolactone decarboxylase family protein YurZ
MGHHDKEPAMVEVKTETADTLRGLAVGESSVLEGLLAMQVENLEDSGLEPRAYAMVKIATLIAVGAPPASFMAQVAFALRVGVTAEEILGVLVAVAPQVGIPRVVAAAPELTGALGLTLDGIGS